VKHHVSIATGSAVSLQFQALSLQSRWLTSSGQRTVNASKRLHHCAL
jgi:hypothetical protein